MVPAVGWLGHTVIVVLRSTLLVVFSVRDFLLFRCRCIRCFSSFATLPTVPLSTQPHSTKLLLSRVMPFG